MRASLIRHVDPWHDAERGARYEGNLVADRLPRLSALAALDAPLRASLSFHRGAEAKKHGAVEVKLEIHGRFDMTCQRCLNPMSIETAIKTSVWIVGDELAANALESLGETIVSLPGERLDVASVVEDEVLLAMPFAPRHPPDICTIKQCPEQGSTDGRSNAGRQSGVEAVAQGTGDGPERMSGSGRNNHGAKGRDTRGVEADTLQGKESRSHRRERDSEPVGGQDRDEKRHPFAVLAVLLDNPGCPADTDEC